MSFTYVLQLPIVPFYIPSLYTFPTVQMPVPPPPKKFLKKPKVIRLQSHCREKSNLFFLAANYILECCDPLPETVYTRSEPIATES